MSFSSIYYCLTRLLLIIATIILISCKSTSRLIYKTKTTENTIGYYISNNPKYQKGEGKFYAHVDSSNVLILYSFQPKNIFKTYNNATNLVYTLVSDKNVMLQFSSIDSIVLAKAEHLLDSLGYKDLKTPKGATGFVVEIARHEKSSLRSFLYPPII